MIFFSGDDGDFEGSLMIENRTLCRQYLHARLTLIEACASPGRGAGLRKGEAQASFEQGLHLIISSAETAPKPALQ